MEKRKGYHINNAIYLEENKNEFYNAHDISSNIEMNWNHCTALALIFQSVGCQNDSIEYQKNNYKEENIFFSSE